MLECLQDHASNWKIILVFSFTCSLIFDIVSIAIIRDCTLYHKSPFAANILHCLVTKLDVFLSHWKIIM